MAHAPAGWRGAPGDESHYRLLAAALGLVLEELRGVFLPRAADLTDHHDRFRRLVGQKHFEDVDELGPLHRIAADTGGCGLTEPLARGLENSFIGERAGARHDANLAG